MWAVEGQSMKSGEKISEVKLLKYTEQNVRLLLTVLYL